MTKGTILARVAGVVALATSLAGTAGAQQPASTAPWRAWLGCWTAGLVTPFELDATQPLICVTPTSSADVVQIATIVDGKVQSTQRVDASGREVPLEAKGCSGTQTGRWSGDGRRIYLRAVATCDGVLRTTTGILAVTPQGEWLDIQGTTVGADEGVRIARFRDVGVRSSVPADIAQALQASAMSVHGARIVAGSAIGTAAVAEAARATSVGVTEAFVLERQQRFDLDASSLVALSDAGVSPRLTDAMIAASNPQSFAVRAARPIERDSLATDAGGRRVYVTMDRYGSPWGWGYDPYGSAYRYDQYGYGRYGYGGYGGYGYPGYGYGGGVIIVREAGGNAGTSHGRMVKGRGYQQGASSPTSADRAQSRDRSAASSERSSPSSSSGTSSGSSGSGSGSSSGSSGSSSGSTEQRTAKPRP